MKRFVTNILFFSLIVIAFLVAGELLIRYSSNPYKIKRENLENRSDSITTVVLGNSHAYYSVRPDIVDKEMFNLANVSQLFEYDYLLLEKYICDLKNLETVILQISYDSFSDPPFEEGPSWFLEAYYKLYFGIDKYSDISILNFELSNFTIFFGKIKSLLLGKTMPSCDKYGFGIDYVKENGVSNLDDSGSEAALRHTAHWGKDWSLYNYGYLKKIMELCKSHNIRTIIFTSPTWESYQDHLEPSQLTQMYDFVDSVCVNYGSVYFDYLKDDRFTENDFYDGDHLNSSGAIKFSKILINDICSISIK